MCRAHSHGGRRCPSNRHATREIERLRKAAYRAAKKAEAAEATGDGTAAREAWRRADELGERLLRARRARPAPEPRPLRSASSERDVPPPASRGRDTADGTQEPEVIPGAGAGSAPAPDRGADADAVPGGDPFAAWGRDIDGAARRARRDADQERRAALEDIVRASRAWDPVARVGRVEVDATGRLRDAATGDPVAGATHADLVELRTRLRVAAADREADASRAPTGDEAAACYRDAARVRSAAEGLTTDPDWVTAMRTDANIAVSIDGRMRRAGADAAAPITPAEVAATRATLAATARDQADAAAAARSRGADAAAAAAAHRARVLGALADHAGTGLDPL